MNTLLRLLFQISANKRCRLEDVQHVLKMIEKENESFLRKQLNLKISCPKILASTNAMKISCRC